MADSDAEDAVKDFIDKYGLERASGVFQDRSAWSPLVPSRLVPNFDAKPVSPESITQSGIYSNTLLIMVLNGTFVMGAQRRSWLGPHALVPGFITDTRTEISLADPDRYGKIVTAAGDLTQRQLQTFSVCPECQVATAPEWICVKNHCCGCAHRKFRIIH